MQVNVQEVKINNINKGKNTYSEAIVVYTTERGENKEKKVMSFSNPAVFAFLSKNQRGLFKVESEGAPYYGWKSIDFANNEGVSTSRPAAAGNSNATTVNRNWETAEERAQRQVLIVKQSAIAQAVASIGPGASLTDYFERAQAFVDWVFDNGQNVGTLDTED